MQEETKQQPSIFRFSMYVKPTEDRSVDVVSGYSLDCQRTEVQLLIETKELYLLHIVHAGYVAHPASLL
jgi:hypothetical protein